MVVMVVLFGFYMVVMDVLQIQHCIVPKTQKTPDQFLGMRASLIMVKIFLIVSTLDSTLKGGLLLAHQQLVVENTQG